MEPVDLVGQKFYLNNKEFEIKEIRTLENGMNLAYYGEAGIINIDILRNKYGSYLYSKDNNVEMKETPL